MRGKREVLKELKALRFDYHARLVLAVFDELNDRIEEIEER